MQKRPSGHFNTTTGLLIHTKLPPRNRVVKYHKSTSITTTSPQILQQQIKNRFYAGYKATVGLQTAFVLGGILFITVTYLFYKTKCRKPLNRKFKTVVNYMKGAPTPKDTENKGIGTNIEREGTKGNWICFDNPDIEPSVEIDALKATALWIMQNHEDELQNLHEVSGIILRVDPDVIHAHDAKEKATWMRDTQAGITPIPQTPLSSDSYCYNSVPQMLTVPVDNQFLQVPNIQIESPRPQSALSNTSVFFSPPHSLLNSFSNDGSHETSSGYPGQTSRSSPPIDELSKKSPYENSVPASPSVSPMLTAALPRVCSMTFVPNKNDNTVDSGSDSQSELDSLLKPSKRTSYNRWQPHSDDTSQQSVTSHHSLLNLNQTQPYSQSSTRGKSNNLSSHELFQTSTCMNTLTAPSSRNLYHLSHETSL